MRFYPPIHSRRQIGCTRRIDRKRKDLDFILKHGGNRKTMSVPAARGGSLAGACGVMAAIFCFSAQDGADSGRLSGGLSAALLRLVTAAPTAEQEELAHHLIRKAAHFSIYALLAVFLAAFFSTFALPALARLGSAAGVSALYAVSDELHQSLIPGRGPSGWDVLLDTAGALAGAGLLLGAAALLHRRRKRRQAAKASGAGPADGADKTGASAHNR